MAVARAKQPKQMPMLHNIIRARHLAPVLVYLSISNPFLLSRVHLTRDGHPRNILWYIVHSTFYGNRFPSLPVTQAREKQACGGGLCVRNLGIGVQVDPSLFSGGSLHAADPRTSLCQGALTITFFLVSRPAGP